MADAIEDEDMNDTEALRGVERQTLELIAEVLTWEEWAALLKAPLERAVARGNRDLAQKLVEAGAAFGDALHEAVEGGNPLIVNDLLKEYEADVETEDERGRTPLHIAASHGKPEMVQLLLLEGADMDALESREFTPLFLAIENKNMATALALLAGGADVSIPHTILKRTALHMAAQTAHVEMLRVVIEHGLDVNAVDSLGYTALHVAAGEDNSEAIDVLMEAGADIEARDIYDATPLFGAAGALKPVAVTSLLRHGADVNSQGDVGDTPLHCAVAYSQTPQEAVEVVDLLLRSGADVDAQDEDGETVLHNVASKAGIQGAAELVDLLLRSGADETITNENGDDAMGVVVDEVEEENRLGEDVNRVKELLMGAPADRAWRRRGYLVLCRVHPDRLQLEQESTNENVDTARRSRSRERLAMAEASGSKDTAGGSLVGERTGGDWAGVVAKVLGLQEEGVFRTIVGYL